jgi:hypothetical protein
VAGPLSGRRASDDPIDAPAVAFEHHPVDRVDGVAVEAADGQAKQEAPVVVELAVGDDGRRRVCDLRVPAHDHPLEGREIELPAYGGRRKGVGQAIVAVPKGFELPHDRIASRPRHLRGRRGLGEKGAGQNRRCDAGDDAVHDNLQPSGPPRLYRRLAALILSLIPNAEAAMPVLALER